MAFAPSSPRGLGHLGSKSLQPLSRVPRKGQFAESFKKMPIPGITLEIKVAPNKPGKNGKGNGNNGGKGGKNGRSNGRPHKDAAKVNDSHPYKDRGFERLNFGSGISSGIVINYFEPSVDGYSTCYIQSGSFFQALDDNMYRSQLDEFVFYEYVKVLQREVRYNIASRLDKDKFYRYFTNVSNALQLFYMVDSIIAYCNNDDIKVKNAGLFELRSRFGSEILSMQQILGETLKTLPIPGNLIKFIRYAYQNFIFSDEEGAPIHRLGFRATLHSESQQSISAEYYVSIIRELNQDLDLVGILNQGFKDKLTNNQLPLSSAEPIFDKSFMSFWVNNSVTYVNPDAKSCSHTRGVDSHTTDYQYFVFNREVDGIFFASQSIFDNNKDCYQSGIWTPYSDFIQLKRLGVSQGSSLLQYSSSRGGFYSIDSTNKAVHSGVFHSAYLVKDKASGLHKFKEHVGIPIGAVKIQSNCFLNLRQPVGESVRYVLDYGSEIEQK